MASRRFAPTDVRRRRTGFAPLRRLGFGIVVHARGNGKRPPGRDTGRPLVRLPAPGLLRFRRDNLDAQTVWLTRG